MANNTTSAGEDTQKSTRALGLNKEVSGVFTKPTSALGLLFQPLDALGLLLRWLAHL